MYVHIFFELSYMGASMFALDNLYKQDEVENWTIIQITHTKGLQWPQLLRCRISNQSVSLAG